VSLLDAPLALLERVRGHREPSVRPDDPVARMVARTTGRLRPAAAYRRRLRGHVVNQYVAVREGLAPAAPRRREMGRIGRSVLYASLALAISVTAVGAASQGSLPGDALYPVKRQLEEVRIDIAPAWARPTLVAHALEERLSELEQLARLGAWDRVAAAASDVDAAEAAFAAVAGQVPDQQQALAHHTDVLTALLAAAPDSAKPGLERALAASTKAAATVAQGPGDHGPAGEPGQAGKDGTDATATPTKSPKPTPTPRASSKPTPSAAPGSQPASPRANSSPAG
jgi:hypothetical protein